MRGSAGGDRKHTAKTLTPPGVSPMIFGFEGGGKQGKIFAPSFVERPINPWGKERRGPEKSFSWRKCLTFYAQEWPKHSWNKRTDKWNAPRESSRKSCNRRVQDDDDLVTRIWHCILGGQWETLKIQWEKKKKINDGTLNLVLRGRMNFFSSESCISLLDRWRQLNLENLGRGNRRNLMRTRCWAFGGKIFCGVVRFKALHRQYIS